ncbi:MAG: GIY-YIG nuclease family protein [Nitrososphaerales archaeon]
MDMAPYFIYVLECSDGTLYTGYTVDLERRLRQHNAGKGARYTRSRMPVKLAFNERYSKKGDALRREIQIKRMSRSSKLLLCAGYPPKPRHSLR